ncbi:MAG: hypothetical protein LBB43_04045 [Spirochaetaceae bacterium]|nr:hypothetical protein [Spirochaetaceae bacterium]
MKLKFIFIVFHFMLIAIVASAIIAMFFIAGKESALDYWYINLPILMVIALFVAALDIFYALHYRMISLLEREDWPALIEYLEQKIGLKGRYSRTQVQLLINTYLVLSDTDSVINLENKLSKEKPELIEESALTFGSARILNRNITGAVRFFSERCASGEAKTPAKKKTWEHEWIQWFYGFSLLLDRQFPQAEEQFNIVLKDSHDPLVLGLAAFFMVDVLATAIPEHSSTLRLDAAAARNHIKKAVPTVSNWNKLLAKYQKYIHVVILTRYVHETASWIYG